MPKPTNRELFDAFAVLEHEHITCETKARELESIQGRATELDLYLAEDMTRTEAASRLGKLMVNASIRVLRFGNTIAVLKNNGKVEMYTGYYEISTEDANDTERK